MKVALGRGRTRWGIVVVAAAMTLVTSLATPAVQAVSGRQRATVPAVADIQRAVAATGQRMAAAHGTQYSTVAASRVITTFAGGMGSPGGVPTHYGLTPFATAFDGPGHLLISDRTNSVVWLANLTGTPGTFFGRTIAAGRMAVIAGSSSYIGGYNPNGDGGPATEAKLDYPAGVAVDSAGNLYIADWGADRIREVLAGTGIITTVAGNGYAGYYGDGGLATKAWLYYPSGVAVDGMGNLFISDSGNNRIREVLAATGVITTVAGNGKSGFAGDGGAAIAAELHQPSDVAVDGAGNLFIADQNNGRIREVLDTTGIITTVAGGGTAGLGDGGPATQAELSQPSGVALDGTGNLFIADAGSNRIREVLAATGVITTVAGNGSCCFGGDGGPATQATLDSPTGVTLDGAGNLLISDQNNHRIRKVVAATGIINTIVGNGTPSYGGDGGRSTVAELLSPGSVAVDSAGNVYIADTLNLRVREVAAATGLISTVAGNGKPGFSGDGSPATQAALGWAESVAVDRSGNLFIADSDQNRIREVIAATGIITTVAGNGIYGFGGDGGPATKAALDFPQSVALDSAGNIFIADQGNQRIREVIATTGIITTVAGNGSRGFSGDGGPATQAELHIPTGVAVDAAGNLFIADYGNNRIREVLAGSGVITTVAGNGSQGFRGDGGPATKASLFDPSGVGVDGAGNLLIADYGNDRIREVVAASGIIITVAGSGVASYEGGSFSGDGGPATGAALDGPSGVAVGSAGTLYIADTLNNRVRVVR